MGGRLSEHAYGDGGYPNRMQKDGSVVKVSKDFDAEGVDDAVGDEEGGVDANCFCGGRLVARFNSCDC